MSFARNFLLGQNIAGDLLSTYESAKQKKEIAEIAQAKPEESTGFTADQGAELERAAASDQYDIGFDDIKQAYTVTPKADPTQTGTIAMHGVTDFMGSRTAGSMTPSQVNSAKERAMAGVLMKSDPVQGMRMMRDVTQGERDDQRWDRQTKQWGIEDADRAEKDTDKAFSKNLEGEVGTWFKSRLSNPDGTAREATVDDHLAASQFKAAKLASAGKMDQAGQIMKDYNSQAYLKIQLESAQRNEALGTAAAALAAGDFGPVKGFYNRFTPDGAQVTNIGRGKDGSIVIERATDDGRPLPPATMKDTGQILAALNTFKDPMALYNWSQNEFRNNLAIKADNRAAAAAGRAAAADNQAREDKTAKATAAVALFKERNPNATQAELDAVQRGILEPIAKSGAYKVEMGDVTSAFGTPAVDAEGKPQSDLLTGRQVVNRDPKKEAAFFQWMADNGITDTNKGLAIYLGQKPSGTAPGGQSASAGAAGPAPKISTKADFDRLPAGARFTAPDGTVRVKQ